jgi:hypothetical protein
MFAYSAYIGSLLLQAPPEDGLFLIVVLVSDGYTNRAVAFAPCGT